jgi:hypothetical protein
MATNDTISTINSGECSVNQPEHRSKAYPSMIHDIEHGRMKVPQFQRGFVWPKRKSAELLDSVIKGYPVGTFILWRTKESLRSIRDLGGHRLPETPAGDFIEYVLDGQQRITSIYVTIKGLAVERDGVTENFADIYLDLEATDEGTIVTTDVTGKDPNTYVRVVDLLNKGLLFLSSYPPEYYNRLEELKRRFDSYLFSTIVLLEAPINVATEVFERINTTGMTLEVFDIMVAKTFDPVRDFDLKEKYDSLIKRLSTVHYGTIPPSVVLQTVSAILANNCDKKTILNLSKDAFINIWVSATEAIESAVDYFRDFYRIPVSALLPYAALIIPFSYFFHKNRHEPVGDKQRYLQDLFWRTSLGGRYSSSLETRVGQDLKRVDDVLADKLPDYDYTIDISPKFIRENGRFAAGRSYIKAILGIYAYQQPKSFDDNSIVRVDNNKLKQANSRNYHHFFPRAYLNKLIPRDPRINHIANITIVDESLNKRQIRDHAPSIYMRKFSQRNPVLKQTMETHLIDIDDFDTFFEKRCERISMDLAMRIIPRIIDSDKPVSSSNDIEEIELEKPFEEDHEPDDPMSATAA